MEQVIAHYNDRMHVKNRCQDDSALNIRITTPSNLARQSSSLEFLPASFSNDGGKKQIPKAHVPSLSELYAKNAAIAAKNDCLVRDIRKQDFDLEQMSKDTSAAMSALEEDIAITKKDKEQGSVKLGNLNEEWGYCQCEMATLRVEEECSRLRMIHLQNQIEEQQREVAVQKYKSATFKRSLDNLKVQHRDIP